MIKNIILFILFCFFFLNVNAAEKQNCSVLKKLSKDYWICKKNNIKGSSDDVGFDTSNIKKKKTLADWFKKKENNLKGSSDDVGFDTSNIKKKKTLADWFKKK